MLEYQEGKKVREDDNFFIFSLIPGFAQLAWTCWLYYISKLVEFIDTVSDIHNWSSDQLWWLDDSRTEHEHEEAAIKS